MTKIYVQVSHFSYWEYDYNEHPIQCSVRVPSDGGLATARCPNNSIGSYIKTSQKAGKKYPHMQDVFFCVEHNIDPAKETRNGSKI